MSKPLKAGKAFDALMGKLAQVPKEEAEREAEKDRKRKEKKRRKK